MTNPVITDPVIVIYRKEGKVAITTCPAPQDTPETVALMICDAIRQIAMHFGEEARIWRAIETERQHPTDAPVTEGVVH